MSPATRVPRPVLLSLAILLATVTLFYTVVWMRAVRWERSSMIGFDDYTFQVHENALEIEAVTGNGPADRAGITAGDQVVAIDGVPFTHIGVLYDRVTNRSPETVVNLAVERPGEAERLEVPVRLAPWPRVERSAAQRAADNLINSYPVFFFVVGFAVLFLRIGNRHAWLLALLFVSIIASGPIIESLGGVPPAARRWALAFRLAFASISGALFYYFLAVFPVSSPLDRRAPWLKWLFLTIQMAIGLPLAVAALIVGNSRPLYLADVLFENQLHWLTLPLTILGFSAFGMGLVSLIMNTMRAPTAEVRRRTRVILWGLGLGPIPLVVIQLVGYFQGRSFFEYPYWIWAPSVLFILVMPLAVAYAVLRHRVLELPVLLRRSARYFLVQRGFLALLVALGAAIVVVSAALFSRILGPGVDPAGSPPVIVALGAALAGVAVVWGLGRVHARIASRIDRAFFRSAYDARQILEDLIDRSRRARSREELLGLLRHHLGEALQPESLTVYLRDDGHLAAADGSAASAVAGRPDSLPVEAPLVAALAHYGRPWDTADETVAELYDAAADLDLAADCLVPVLDRDGGTLGLIALGARRSEEPYSGEDRRLLAGIAGQMGLSLESFALAEDIARRIETERRVAQEMEVARQVQRNLLPRRAPSVRSLELAAHCVQARAVGGDFFDYLPLGEDRLGLVLADISGKGMSAALLMSSLQATLRSRTTAIPDDPVGVLREVNQRLLASTESGQFATLFLGDWEAGANRLRYVNCGHNPPLILRRDGALERLDATATVLGAFPDWPCEEAAVELAAGDLLVIYSDGVTEAGGENGELFGEARLVDVLRAHHDDPIDGVLQAILAAVTGYGDGSAEDDLTLLVARATTTSPPLAVRVPTVTRSTESSSRRPAG